MIDVYVSFENAAQIRQFRSKLIRDFRCSATRCGKCPEEDVCEIMAWFIDDLCTAELKHNAMLYRDMENKS